MQKKLYTALAGRYKSTDAADLKTVGVISGRCNIASSPVGLDWIDL